MIPLQHTSWRQNDNRVAIGNKYGRYRNFNTGYGIFKISRYTGIPLKSFKEMCDLQ